MKEIKVLVKDIKTEKKFYKYFDTEFERDKFLRRLRYSKRLILIDSCIEDWLN